MPCNDNRSLEPAPNLFAEMFRKDRRVVPVCLYKMKVRDMKSIQERGSF